MADFPYLKPGCIAILDALPDSDAVLRKVAALATTAPELHAFDDQAVFDALLDRERQSSTGLEKGVAIPHCRLDSVSDFVVGVLVVRDGVDFRAVDGSPSRLFVFIIGPTAMRDLHIRILSAVSRGLLEDRAIETLVSATTADEVVSFLRERISLTEPAQPKEMSQVTLFLQSEAAFEAVCDVFANPAYGSAMVVDAANAGRNLHSLPLFSAFWTDGPEDFTKLVIAVVPKAMTNEVLRKVNLSTADGEPGVLATVQELSFVSGSLPL